MKIKFKIISLIVALFLMCSFNYYNAYADDCVYLGGMTAGFSLYTRGAEVVGVCDVITEQGLCSPAKDLGIQEGDIILKLNNNQINNALDIKNNLTKSDTIIEYTRGDEKFLKTITPVKDINGNYKLGVFVKDCISGIGTITYIKNNRFASLGHPVLDNDEKILEINGGELYNCNISGFVKGERGKAGEIRGSFVKHNPIGRIDKNLACGVYGQINDNFNKKGLVKIDLGQAKVGDACIYTTLENGQLSKYDIAIVKIDDELNTKNFVIKITDNNLLNITGGIIQGMSGSPIVQNNKLVGAVTHVFINDPTRGFGISINNMINN